MNIFKIYCDGGSRGNPGPAASAFVVYENKNVTKEGSLYLGEKTNNIAEYSAVLIALEWLKNNIPKKSTVEFYLDSQLITNQLKGKYKVKNIELKKLFDRVKQLESESDFLIDYNFVYRANNKRADALVNSVLDNNKNNFDSLEK